MWEAMGLLQEVYGREHPDCVMELENLVHELRELREQHYVHSVVVVMELENLVRELRELREQQREQRRRALQCAIENLWSDRDVVLAAVKQNGRALRCASEDLQHDDKISAAAAARVW